MSRQGSRISPVAEAVAALRPRSAVLRDMRVALDYGDPAREAEHLSRLALCDASLFPRIGVIGKAASDWLAGMGVSVPGAIHETLALEPDGLCQRLGRHEFVIEDGLEGTMVERLARALGTGSDAVYPIEHQDAQLWLSGERAPEVLAQTCGYDFRTPGDALVFTRIAGVSCSVLHQAHVDAPHFRLWLDPTYAEYLWETLLEIVREMGGGPAGLANFHPRVDDKAE